MSQILAARPTDLLDFRLVHVSPRAGRNKVCNPSGDNCRAPQTMPGVPGVRRKRRVKRRHSFDASHRRIPSPSDWNIPCRQTASRRVGQQTCGFPELTVFSAFPLLSEVPATGILRAAGLVFKARILPPLSCYTNGGASTAMVALGRSVIPLVRNPPSPIAPDRDSRPARRAA